MSDPQCLAIARRLIAEEAKQQTGSLDLGKLGLTAFPAEIATLRGLRQAAVFADIARPLANLSNETKGKGICGLIAYCGPHVLAGASSAALT